MDEIISALPNNMRVMRLYHHQDTLHHAIQPRPQREGEVPRSLDDLRRTGPRYTDVFLSGQDYSTYLDAIYEGQITLPPGTIITTEMSENVLLDDLASQGLTPYREGLTLRIAPPQSASSSTQEASPQHNNKANRRTCNNLTAVFPKGITNFDQWGRTILEMGPHTGLTYIEALLARDPSYTDIPSLPRHQQTMWEDFINYKQAMQEGGERTGPASFPGTHILRKFRPTIIEPPNQK